MVGKPVIKARISVELISKNWGKISTSKKFLKITQG